MRDGIASGFLLPAFSIKLDGGSAPRPTNRTGVAVGVPLPWRRFTSSRVIRCNIAAGRGACCHGSRRCRPSFHGRTASPGTAWWPPRRLRRRWSAAGEIARAVVRDDARRIDGMRDLPLQPVATAKKCDAVVMGARRLAIYTPSAPVAGPVGRPREGLKNQFDLLFLLPSPQHTEAHRARFESESLLQFRSRFGDPHLLTESARAESPHGQHSV